MGYSPLDGGDRGPVHLVVSSVRADRLGGSNEARLSVRYFRGVGMLSRVAADACKCSETVRKR